MRTRGSLWTEETGGLADAFWTVVSLTFAESCRFLTRLEKNGLDNNQYDIISKDLQRDRMDVWPVCSFVLPSSLTCADHITGY